MKMKVLASILCACLMFFIFTGCGMKMPDDSGTSPSVSASGSPSGGSMNTTAVTGIVSYIDSETITIDLAVPAGAQTEDAATVDVGASVYTLTGGTESVIPDAGTAVVFQNQGFASGSLDDIMAGEFLAIILQGDKVLTVIDAGAVEVNYIETEGEQPIVSPTNSSEEPSPGIPDTTEPAAYTVTTDSLKVRSGPSTEYSVLGALDTGSRIIGIITDGWIKYTYNGKEAYSSAEYIETSTAPEGVSDSSESKTYTTADNLIARSGPGTTYSSLGTLAKGTEITGTVLGGWCKFTYNDTTAYCSASYLSAG